MVLSELFSKELWNYALINLNNRKVRSLLTILSIFVGISTIFIFVSFGWGLYDYVDDISEEMGVDKVIVRPKGIGPPGADSSFALLDDDLEVIEKTRGVEEVAGMIYKSGKLESDDQIRYNYVVSLPVYDDDKYKLTKEFFTIELLKGREINEGNDNKVMLGHGYTVPDRIFDEPLDINEKIVVNDKKFKIIGFFDEIGNPSDDAIVYMTENSIEEMYPDDHSFSMLTARVEDPKEIDDVVERVKKNLRKHRDLEEGKEDFFVQTFEEMIAAFSTSLNLIVGFVILIALISVFTSAVNTANTMFTSILERTREIGILKAVGATNIQILVIFLMESSILGFIAGLIGALAGVGLTYISAEVLADFGYSFLKPHYSILLFVLCIAFATIIGTISGIIPAYNASKKNPVDSLRYE